MGSRNITSRTKIEEFESADDSIQPAQLANTNRPQTAYDILGKDCGASPSDLAKWARIRRLKAPCKVHQYITDYVKNSSGNATTNIKAIYKIERHDEREPFEETYRIMLWHGTSPAAIAGIIQNGFRMGSGGLFGGGIYFADRLAKSMGYVRRTSANTGFFILAEVCPGRVYKSHNTHGDYKTAPQGFNSVKGMGGQIPRWKENQHYLGAILPCGVTVQNTRHPSFNLVYNEYIMYDADRIIVRFVVEVNL